MSSAPMVLEVRPLTKCGTSFECSHTLAGVTRKLIGATFAGQTKEADGQVWADLDLEGLSDDVSISFGHDDGAWKLTYLTS